MHAKGTMLGASLILACCGSGGAPCGDAGVDTGSDTAAETGDDTATETGPDAFEDQDGPAPDPCPAPAAESCSAGAPHSPDPIPVLARASDLDPGTRFINLAPGFVVLAEREASDVRTVEILQVDASELDPALVILARLELPPGSTLGAVAAVRRCADHGDTALPELVALLCDGASCALYGADLDPAGVSDLSPIPGGEVPASGGKRGLWWEAGPAACAYGDGIDCFDGREWTPVVASGEAPFFNDMETCGFFTVAVGEMGRTAISAWPDWIDGYGAIYPDMLTVTCYEDTYLMAGEGGIVMNDSMIACDVTDEDIAFLDAGDIPYEDLLLGVTASGRVFIGRKPFSSGSGLCFTGQTLGTLVAATAEPCGISYNYHLLTADTLYGTVDCMVD